MPERVGTRWEGGHLEVPVGRAVAVWRLISDLKKSGEREREILGGEREVFTHKNKNLAETLL